MAKVSYTLTNRGEFGVVIKMFVGNSYHYPYNALYSYLEVDNHFEHATMKIKTWRNEEEWTYRLMAHENDSLANWQSRESACRYFGEDAILKAENQVRRNIRSTIKLVKAGRKNPVWLSLKPIADDVVAHYLSDFYYHDALTLQKYQPEKFLWFVRSAGTWLIRAQGAFESSIISNEEKRREHRVFLYTRGELTEISMQDARGIYNTLPKSE